MNYAWILIGAIGAGLLFGSVLKYNSAIERDPIFQEIKADLLEIQEGLKELERRTR